ncbi:MAG: methyltransferase domain-containing protein, partial [Armatimonadota bacterium]
MQEAEISHLHYADGDYLTKSRFISYWHQINEVLRCGADRVLEVGVGSQVVASSLMRMGKCFVTLDLNPALQPNVVGSIEALPFADEAFELAMAGQVLEHL